MADALNPYAEVASALRGTGFSDIRYLETTASTNDDAQPLLGVPAHYGLTIVAEQQTRGSGRKGRSWIAAPGTSLLATTILPGTINAAHLWVVPFGVAICVRRALAMNGVEAALHWPNDLLLGERKVAGILCASRIVGDRAWVAAGVGINVHRKNGAAEGIEPPPAFCDDVAPLSRATLLRDMLLNYSIWNELLDMPPRIARLWERQAGLPGVPYRILEDGATEAFEASAIALAPGGGLVVALADGTRKTIALADARALRD